MSFGAEDEAQTRDPQLGRLMLYQLSYFRIVNKSRKISRFQLYNGLLKVIIVGEDGFEPPKA